MRFEVIYLRCINLMCQVIYLMLSYISKMPSHKFEMLILICCHILRFEVMYLRCQ